jgi:hypothetical protein
MPKPTCATRKALWHKLLRKIALAREASYPSVGKGLPLNATPTTQNSSAQTLVLESICKNFEKLHGKLA